jgi:glycogen operon protein
MLLAGDEIANSQDGNNNAYCQDNPIGWVAWDEADEALLAFTRRLIAFRRAHSVLRQDLFLHGRTRPEDGKADVAWRSFDGGAVNWRDEALEGFCLVLRGSAEAPPYRDTDDAVMLAFNGGATPARVALPATPADRVWLRALDTADPEAEPRPCNAGQAQTVAAQSVAAFALGRAA